MWSDFTTERPKVAFRYYVVCLARGDQYAVGTGDPRGLGLWDGSKWLALPAHWAGAQPRYWTELLDPPEPEW
jgi:hypothetical protein